LHENLQPLRIPPQWSLLWNHLRPIEPGDLAEDDPAWLFTFVQDMLYLRKNSDEQSVAIDLGWYPEGDPQGAYELVTILNDDWNNPLLAFTSRSTQESDIPTNDDTTTKPRRDPMDLAGALFWFHKKEQKATPRVLVVGCPRGFVLVQRQTVCVSPSRRRRAICSSPSRQTAAWGS